MADHPIGDDDYVADAERHNQWWSTPGASPSDLTTVAALPTRSDLHRLLERTNTLQANDVATAHYGIYGQTGIGKTTLLQQFIAALLPDDTIPFNPSRRSHAIAGAVDPRQILYLPLEAGLYHATPPRQALDALINVIEYHHTRIAPRNATRFVILDDIGALNLSENRKRDLVDAIDDQTYLYTTGIVHDQVTLPSHPLEQTIGPIAMLPMKFIDALKQSGYGDAGPGNISPDLADNLEHHQSSEQEGLLHRAKKHALRAHRDVETAVAALEEFHADILTQDDRDALADAAREYLRTGGLLFRAQPDDVRNDLVRSHFLLYLYKELARYEAIKQPENLHRLCAIIANSADRELNYNAISDALGVDRRTIGTYFDALDDGLAVTESHDYSLQRHRRTRPYLRNPRHVVSLSQRATHYGYETYTPTGAPNPDFEYTLARTTAFDHAMRLAHGTNAIQAVEYTETDGGTIDYILRLPDDDRTLVLPFALEYAPHGRDAETALTEFDPATGTHLDKNNEPIETTYSAPYRFLITDREPTQSLTERYEDHTLCRLPFWLYLLIC